MKTPSMFLVGAALVAGGLFVASSQPVAAGNHNQNNSKPKPVPIPRKVVKKEPKQEIVPKVVKITPPVQQRIEQPKLPPGFKVKGPGLAPVKLRNLTKLKLLPPMKRKGNRKKNAALTQEGSGENDRESSLASISDERVSQAEVFGSKDSGETRNPTLKPKP